MDISFLDCCHDPQLQALRVLYESTHDLESLQRCTGCGAFWFYRFHEWVNYCGGDDDLTSWYTQLTDDDGRRLLRQGDRPDLSFLAGCPSWMDDRDGVRRVAGAPTGPRS